MHVELLSLPLLVGQKKPTKGGKGRRRRRRCRQKEREKKKLVKANEGLQARRKLAYDKAAKEELVSAMKKDSPPPHRGGEIVRGLPCVKKLNQGGVNISFGSI